MKTAEKILLFLLVLSLLTACGGSSETASSKDTASEETAQSTEPEASAPDTDVLSEDAFWDLSFMGIKIPMPKAYLENRGKVYIYPAAETLTGEDGTRIAIIRFFLYPVSEDVLLKLDETQYDAITPDIEITNIVAGIPEGKGAETLNSIVAEYGADWDAFLSDPLGSNETYTYYECFMESLESARRNPSGDLADIYEAVREDLSGSIREAVYSDTVGEISFTTEDLYGNPVDSSELFSENKVTMINLWTTWCTYCIREMPEIEAIYEEYKDKGVTVVGILMDAGEPGALDEAGELIAQTGVLYQNLKPNAAIESSLPVSAYPTTYFVDENGTLIGEAVVGADTEAYRARLEEYIK